MSLFSDHLSNKNFNLVFPSDLLCLKDNCIAIVDNNNPAPIAWDYGHLTDVGSLFLASKILQ